MILEEFLQKIHCRFFKGFSWKFIEYLSISENLREFSKDYFKNFFLDFPEILQKALHVFFQGNYWFNLCSSDFIFGGLLQKEITFNSSLRIFVRILLNNSAGISSRMNHFSYRVRFLSRSSYEKFPWEHQLIISGNIPNFLVQTPLRISRNKSPLRIVRKLCIPFEEGGGLANVYVKSVYRKKYLEGGGDAWDDQK